MPWVKGSRSLNLRRLNPDAAKEEADPNEAERAVQRDHANADTGNEVLDVVLTEKSMHCEARHITLNCVADGSAVAFVEPGDLHALFSNALDQAIDAAARQMDEPRPDQRPAGAVKPAGLHGHQHHLTRRNRGPRPGRPPA